MPTIPVFTQLLHIRNHLGPKRVQLDKKISVSIIIKHSATSYPPDNNMMQRTGSIYAGLTWHHIFISNE